MRVLRNSVGLVVCALLVLSHSAHARELTIANVTDKVACVFTPSCGVAVTDTTGFVQLFGDSGYGRLLTRTYPGMPGAQGAGLTGYSFQLNMAGAMSLGMPNCAVRLTLDTGPLVPLRYSGKATADLFVVGGSSGVGISSASQSGSKLTVTFSRPLCPGMKTASQSLYFGFAAKNGPMPGKGSVGGSLQGAATVDVRVPKH
jgi:hypothetical protein